MWFLQKPRGLWPHAWITTQTLRGILRSLARWRIFNVTVVNREAVPKKGRVIIACNHISVADPVFLWGAIRRNAVALAMAELWRIPGVNLIMWLLGHIPVKRGDVRSGKRALTTSIQILEHEGLVIIYPEGKCSKTGELLRFRPGVAEMALATNTPIIPTVIAGSNRVKPLGTWRIYRKQPVRLEFGEPIHPSNFTGPEKVSQLLAELRRQIMIMG